MANQISPRGGRRTNIIPRAIPKRNIPALALLLPPGKADDDTPGDDFDRAILRNNASDRLAVLEAAPDACSLTCGTVNFGDEVFPGDALKLHPALAGANHVDAGLGGQPPDRTGGQPESPHSISVIIPACSARAEFINAW